MLSYKSWIAGNAGNIKILKQGLILNEGASFAIILPEVQDSADYWQQPD